MKDTEMKNKRSKDRYPALMSEGATEQQVVRAQSRLLEEIWTRPMHSNQPLFVNLCFRKKASTKMQDRFFELGNATAIRAILLRYDRHRFDQYFSPNIYSRPRRMSNGVLMTRLGWCDVDKVDPFAFEPKPSVVWQTSPGNTQALWFWDRLHPPSEAQAFSKALAYRHGGDKGGNAPNKLLRLPGSFNHKPEYEAPFIPLVHFNPKPITTRPRPLTGKDGVSVGDIEPLDMNPYAHDRPAVLKKYRSKLDTSTRHLIRHDEVLASDRSARRFAIVAGLYEAGATLDEIASVLWTSPYFREKYGKDLSALETEISRIIARVEAAQ